jgi:FtsP/CotA-like multicopper oxidase with cupredoxin domain
MPVLSRRGFLAGAALLAAGVDAVRSSGPPSYAAALAAPAEPATGGAVAAHFVAAERQTALPCFDGSSLPMWTFSDTNWLPVIRLNLGDRLETVIDNRLPREGEHTSIHWHGIRLPNDQDGVPYLVQKPVFPGESHRYSFVPPDTGTFWFHTHCNTAEQLGRGLVGLLIVDGDTTEPYIADQTILLRDWRVDLEQGAFRKFVTTRGASRAGSYGNVRSANGAIQAEIPLPSSADCRLRIVNTDPTRIIELALDGAEAAVIAIDGVAVPPFQFGTWLLGPAMRIDLVVRAPEEGGVAHILDQRVGEPVALVRLIGSGAAGPRKSFDPLPLRAGHIPEPNIAEAGKLTFVFASVGSDKTVAAADNPLDALAIGSLCLASNDFWTINGKAWPGRDHSNIPPPLARLERGRSYVFKLRNDSKLIHPIHIHGHTFKVLRSSQRNLPIHHADTVLLMPEETVEVAFVADNPGRWMFHCHVIEHQETGMMGYLEVA